MMKTNITHYLFLLVFMACGATSCVLVPPTCVPTAPTPADNGNVCDPGTRTLSWPAVTDATMYDVYLNTGTAAPTTLVSADQTGTSYTTTLALGNYSWQVIPKNAQGPATGCGYWKFTVVNSVTPTISVTHNTPDTICAGTSVTYNAAITNGGTAPFYQWKKNNVAISNTGATFVDAAPTLGDLVTATLTSNSASCLTTTIVTSANDTLKSVVLGIPIVDIISDGDTSFCSGGKVTLRTTATAPVYQWMRNGGDIAGANTSSYETYQTGMYAVRASIGGGRCASTSREVAVKSITVYPRLNRNGNTLTTDPNFSVYQWYFNGVAIPGANADNYVVTRDGAYSVTATDNLGCTGSSAVLPVNNLAVGTLVNVDEVNVYPNPTSGIVNINAPVLLNVHVLDGQGRLVMQKDAVKSIDMSTLANGIYVIQLMDKNNNVIKVEKLIKKDF